MRQSERDRNVNNETKKLCFFPSLRSSSSYYYILLLLLFHLVRGIWPKDQSTNLRGSWSTSHTVWDSFLRCFTVSFYNCSYARARDPHQLEIFSFSLCVCVSVCFFLVRLLFHLNLSASHVTFIQIIEYTHCIERTLCVLLNFPMCASVRSKSLVYVSFFTALKASFSSSRDGQRSSSDCKWMCCIAVAEQTHPTLLQCKSLSTLKTIL